MGDKSGISWTDATWNPIAGCSIVSPGCKLCYAMDEAARQVRMSAGAGRSTHYEGTVEQVKGVNVWTGKIAIAPDHIWARPLGWRRPRKVFVNSMSDLFHPDVPAEVIDRAFVTMIMCPQHSFQVLTKRSDRMREYLSDPTVCRRLYEAVCDVVIEEDVNITLVAPGLGDPPDDLPKARVYLGTWPISNVWLGVSAENQLRADQRVPDLLATPAAVRFVSAEPLLERIDFTRMPFQDGDPRNSRNALTGRADLYCTGVNGHPDITVRTDKERPLAKLDWIIVGGESDRGSERAREFKIEWARDIQQDCRVAGTRFFMKQTGARVSLGDQPYRVTGAGSDPAQWPADIRVQEFPACTSA